MSKEIKPGEWQVEVNQWGGTRRFRMIGGCKEYETEVITSHGTYTQSQIEKGISKPKTVAPEVKTDSKYCPFKSGNRILCRKDCAFWSESGCMQSANTEGKKCPFWLYSCESSCKLFNNGCSLIRKER